MRTTRAGCSSRIRARLTPDAQPAGRPSPAEINAEKGYVVADVKRKKKEKVFFALSSRFSGYEGVMTEAWQGVLAEINAQQTQKRDMSWQM